MNRSALRATVVSAALFSGLFTATALNAPAPRLLWNASASAPIGLYWVDVNNRPAVGDLVVIAPPPLLGAYLERRGYLPRGVPLLKRVAALPGARICRSGVFVTIDGAGVARALARDRAGRALPVWAGCRIVRSDELVLVNAARDSLDSRYFGPMPASGLLGTARPLLVRASPAAPLRWRPAAFANSSSLQKVHLP